MTFPLDIPYETKSELRAEGVPGPYYMSGNKDCVGIIHYTMFFSGNMQEVTISYRHMEDRTNWLPYLVRLVVCKYKSSQTMSNYSDRIRKPKICPSMKRKMKTIRLMVPMV